jgi:glycosyltransferase involved in cell wall biosynthesis
MPLVSVILPTCDRPEELAEALESLAAQTFTDFEVVLANDGETDISEMVRRFKESYPITYVGLGGGNGASAARNAALKAAEGELIAYLDDDDRYLPRHLETLVAVVQGGADVAYTDAELCYFRREGGKRHILERKVVFSQDFDAKALLVYNYITMQCVMHRRYCLDKSGRFNEELESLVDWDLFIRLSLYFEFKHVSEATVEYMKALEPDKRDNLLAADHMRNLFNLLAIYARYAKAADVDPRVATEQARYLGRRLMLTAAEEHAAARSERAKMLTGLAAELAAARDNPGRARQKMSRMRELLG